MNLFKKLTHWYLSRSALPYWCVLFMDLAIGYFSGLLVFWFYYRGAIMLGNIIPLSKTIGIYLLFSLIGFRIFHTYKVESFDIRLLRTCGISPMLKV